MSILWRIKPMLLSIPCYRVDSHNVVHPDNYYRFLPLAEARALLKERPDITAVLMPAASQGAQVASEVA